MFWDIDTYYATITSTQLEEKDPHRRMGNLLLKKSKKCLDFGKKGPEWFFFGLIFCSKSSFKSI